jgi:hypothetical protein
VTDDLASSVRHRDWTCRSPAFTCFSSPCLRACRPAVQRQPRVDLSDSSGDGPRPHCDTSVRYIDMGTRVRNVSGANIEFNLVGRKGPRLRSLVAGLPGVFGRPRRAHAAGA